MKALERLSGLLGRALRLPAARWGGLAGLLLLGGGLVLAQFSYRGHLLPLEPGFVPEPPDGDVPAEFYFARLAYSDPWGDRVREHPWMIDSPAAERHFLQGVRRLSNIDARSKEVYLRATDEEVFDYPWLYAVEAGHWDITEEEAAALREYMLRGGFMIFDDFHGAYEWAFFMRGLRKIFPERPVVDLKSDDEVFHVLYDTPPNEQIPGLQFLFTGQTWEHEGKIPHWRGIYDDEGRLMAVINFNMDLGDAWEHADLPEYPERYTAMAYRFGINYIIYSMTH
jgi:Domain of unknown function (DUF4159)